MRIFNGLAMSRLQTYFYLCGEPAGSSQTCGFSSLTALMVAAAGIGRDCGVRLQPPPLLGTSHWVICDAFCMQSSSCFGVL